MLMSDHVNRCPNAAPLAHNLSHPQGPRNHSGVSYLPVDVLLQTDGAVGGGAATQGIRRAAAALALAFSFGLELARLHLFQSLDGHSVHGALRWGHTLGASVNKAEAKRHVRRLEPSQGLYVSAGKSRQVGCSETCGTLQR